MESNNLETKISLLERDHERFMVILERLDTNLGKLTELSSSIKQMIAVQENRLDNNDDRHNLVEKRLEKHSDRLDALERWRWYLTGAVLIIAFIVPYLAQVVLKN